MAELSQLAVLRELTAACRSSVTPTAPDGSTDASRTNSSESRKQLNRHQIQVALIEISHLVVGVGEAGAASLEDLLPVLQDCLSHSDHGVRHESAAVYAAIAQSFPTEGRNFVIESLSGFAANLDAIQSLSFRVASDTPSPKPRFRKGANKSLGSGLQDELMQHQCHMHGNALAVSMLMHEFPHIMGGVASVIVSKLFDVTEKLLRSQSNESFLQVSRQIFLWLCSLFTMSHGHLCSQPQANPSAACTCIRAGYCLLSGALTMGIDSVIPHVTSVFTLWQNSSMSVLPGVSKLPASYDLLVVESLTTSVVSLLKFCPNLLLAVPDALNRLTALLEEIFPLISSGGRFEQEGNSAIGSVRLSSARSSVMEAYSWLPPGSFPMSADRIFTFAANQIQVRIIGDCVECFAICSNSSPCLFRNAKGIEWK